MATGAIITGSDSGIGKATAVRFAKDGFDIGVTWHSDRDGAESTAREVQRQGRRAVVAQLDVTDLANAADTVDTLAEAVAFLARPDARYTTGSSIVVDGGLMLGAAEFNRAAAS